MIQMCMFLCLTTLGIQAAAGVGDSIVLKEIRVTLLDAHRLTLEEYREAQKPDPADWAGGGFYFAFLVENRPGSQLPPALGEVRVLIESKLYNPVTNATSQKPFAPLVIIQDESDFFSRSRAADLKRRAPKSRGRGASVILEVFVPGTAIPKGTAGVVELEQAETYRPDGSGGLRQLQPEEMQKAWIIFRFAFPPV